MSDVDYNEYKALGPFFDIIMKGVKGHVTADNFFDIFSEDILWEYPYPLPGSHTEIRGRDTLIRHFRGYGDVLSLDSMSDLIVHPTDEGVVLEYSSHGKGVQTGRPYHNRYVSFLYIADGKVYRWRDYSNPLVVLDTLGGFDDVLKSMHEGI